MCLLYIFFILLSIDGQLRLLSCLGCSEHGGAYIFFESVFLFSSGKYPEVEISHSGFNFFLPMADGNHADMNSYLLSNFYAVFKCCSYKRALHLDSVFLLLPA